MRKIFLALIGACTLMTGSPLLARTLEVPPTAAWKHAASALVFSRNLAGLARRSVSDSGTQELDVTIQYKADDGLIWATVFVFRPAENIAPIWFEQSRQQIEHRPGYTHYKNAQMVQPVAFAPVAGGIKTGLRLTYPLENQNLDGTALAVVPVGDWLVAVRVSSTQTSVEGLESRLIAFLSAIRWPQTAETGPEALPVFPCEVAMAFKTAKVIKPEIGNALIDSMMGILAEQERVKQAVTPKLARPFCKDPISTVSHGIYREGGETDGYIMAFNDAGISIRVGQSISLDSRQRYSVTLRELDRDLVYPSFNRLPSPDQVLAVIKKPAVSATSRGSTNLEVTLPSQ